jgi:hypothetical protein
VLKYKINFWCIPSLRTLVFRMTVGYALFSTRSCTSL